MDKQFYLTLPSNSSKGNTAETFTTSLPVHVHLEGEWEVGLAEIIYGNTWYNVYPKNNQIVLKVKENNSTILINIPSGRYEKVAGLIETISKEIEILQKISKIDLQSCFNISALPKTPSLLVVCPTQKCTTLIYITPPPPNNFPPAHVWYVPKCYLTQLSENYKLSMLYFTSFIDFAFD